MLGTSNSQTNIRVLVLMIGRQMKSALKVTHGRAMKAGQATGFRARGQVRVLAVLLGTSVTSAKPQLPGLYGPRL